jgi:hypothetical protein
LETVKIAQPFIFGFYCPLSELQQKWHDISADYFYCISAMKTFFLSFCIFLLPVLAAAQEASTEGTAGSIDKKHRAPVLTVNPVSEATQVRLLADAYIPNEAYQKFPIQFDFYVNRKLISSQIRSVEQPGPVGLNIGRDIAVPPFNFSVVATLLHTNRQFVTIAQGEVFADSIGGTFSCNLSETPASADAKSKEFTNQAVSFTQSDTSSLTFDFKAASADATEDRQVTGTFAISKTDQTVSGTLSIDKGDAQEVTGSAVVTGDSITSLTAETSSASIDATKFTLECSNNGTNADTSTVTTTEVSPSSNPLSPSAVDQAIEALINGKK